MATYSSIFAWRIPWIEELSITRLGSVGAGIQTQICPDPESLNCAHGSPGDSYLLGLASQDFLKPQLSSLTSLACFLNKLFCMLFWWEKEEHCRIAIL